MSDKRLISVRVNKGFLSNIKDLIKEGKYDDRSEFIHCAIREYLQNAKNSKLLRDR